MSRITDAQYTLITPTGDDILYVEQKQSDGSYRSRKARYGDSIPGGVNVVQYGAIDANEAVSAANLTAFNAALAASREVVIPAKTYHLSGMPNFNGHVLKCEGAVLIIDDTQQALAARLDIEYCEGLTIKGKNAYSTTISSVVSVTGSSREWTVTLALASTANIAIGDGLLIEKVRPGSGKASNFSGRPPLGALEETFGKTLGRLSGSGSTATFTYQATSAQDITDVAQDGDILVGRGRAHVLSGFSTTPASPPDLRYTTATVTPAFVNDFVNVINYYIARAAAGTVTCNGTTAVVGVGTSFLLHNVGDIFGTVGGGGGVISAIADNNNMTVDRNLKAVSGATYFTKTHGEHHMGCWKVTGIAGNNVTLVNTSYGAMNKPPVNNVNGGVVTVVKTALNASFAGFLRLKYGSIRLEKMAVFGTGAGNGIDLRTAEGEAYCKLGAKFGLNGFSYILTAQNSTFNGENAGADGIYLSNWTARCVDLQDNAQIQMREAKVCGGVGYGVYVYQAATADINSACFAGASLGAVRQEQGSTVTGEYYQETGCGVEDVNGNPTEGFLSYGNSSAHLVGMCASKSNGQALVESNGGQFRGSNFCIIAPTKEGMNFNNCNAGIESGQILWAGTGAGAIFTDCEIDFRNSAACGASASIPGVRSISSEVNVEQSFFADNSNGIRAEKTAKVHGDAAGFAGNTVDAFTLGNLSPQILLTNAVGLTTTSKTINSPGVDGLISDGNDPTGVTQPLTNYGGFRLDGTTHFLDGSAITGIADGKKGTFVVDVRFANAATVVDEILIQATGDRFYLKRLSSGNIQCIAKNAAGTTIYSQATTGAPCLAAGTYTIAVSYDLAVAGSSKITVNGADKSAAVSTFTNDTIDYTVAEYSIGAGVAGADKVSGDIYRVMMYFAQALSLTTVGGQAVFRAPDGAIEYTGLRGELPTGSPADVFLGYGSGSAWAQNRGAATVAFVINGTAAAPATARYGRDYNAKKQPRVFTAAGNTAMAVYEETLVVNKTVGAATAVTLPPYPVAGDVAEVKEGKGDGAANNVTVSAHSGNIDGAATNVISSNYGIRRYRYNGTEWNVM